ncbi:hypothetical protein BB561_006774 [Smittium simulii]|uniref:Elongation factor methyltransferase 7 n=1 Tax=Smittium simulii TaxID=133385 RepID=A0A2T9Y1L3_9FUNG|nr:hypothetical protein BB561_006774 [Smittium simulii]
MSNEEQDLTGLFELAEDTQQPPEAPELHEYKLQSPLNGITSLSLTLATKNPLWGHVLTNTAKIMAQYIQEHLIFSPNHSKNVCEVGAGAALPSLVCALMGAHFTLITDYPDTDLILNIQANITRNFSSLKPPPAVKAEGFCWGKSTESFSSMLAPRENYDLLILCDVIFNHSEHRKLLTSCKELLTNNKAGQDTGQALVFFTHHRVRKVEQDLHFFELAKEEFGFKVTKLLEVYTGPLFSDEVGDIKIRGTVHGYKMTL